MASQSVTAPATFSSAVPKPACRRPFQPANHAQTAGRSQRSRLVVAAASGERRPQTVREQLGRTQAADSNKRPKRDREDLYTDAWDGDVYRGSPFNILNIILVVSVLTPLAGLAFAYWSFGRLWG